MDMVKLELGSMILPAYMHELAHLLLYVHKQIT